jgi:hypothetical protein
MSAWVGCGPEVVDLAAMRYSTSVDSWVYTFPVESAIADAKKKHGNRRPTRNILKFAIVYNQFSIVCL